MVLPHTPPSLTRLPACATPSLPTHACKHSSHCTCRALAWPLTPRILRRPTTPQPHVGGLGLHHQAHPAYGHAYIHAVKKTFSTPSLASLAAQHDEQPPLMFPSALFGQASYDGSVGVASASSAQLSGCVRGLMNTVTVGDPACWLQVWPLRRLCDARAVPGGPPARLSRAAAAVGRSMSADVGEVGLIAAQAANACPLNR